MIPELGNYAIILALCFALLQGIVPLYQYLSSRTFQASPLSTTAALGHAAWLLFAMICLILCFLTNDMSVSYVQAHSHASLPLRYRIGAAWGGHEGSLLLWCLILGGWTSAFILFGKQRLPDHSYQLIVTLLGWISTGFLLFLLLTSNPFQRVFPTDLVSGDDLTPILQDPGLIFHPPMLYLGYVGFVVAFAFALCALIEGSFTKAWAQSLRPWILMPWACLSVGIVLGSWWAYRELGWGGWWFWDPVENASLLPWLSATALLHALSVSEKREAFKGWTLLLALVTFALSLLGTFLVRSGVLVSVHTFANDPTRGLFLLAYLALIIGGALTLYAARIPRFYRAPTFTLWSRETFLLLNSVILLTVVATICLGTLYPIALEAMTSEKISVGEPYFTTVFLPMMVPLLFLMGIAPHVSWQSAAVGALRQRLRFTLILSLLLSWLLPWLCGFPFYWLATLGFWLGIWVILTTLQSALSKTLGLKQAAMVIAHIGIGILTLGITCDKSYSEEKQVRMQPGETVSVAGYAFHFTQLVTRRGENYQSATAFFQVGKPPAPPAMLLAEQRLYDSHQQVLSQPGILANPWRDLYLALGAPLAGDAWTVRIYYKPLVRWIWAGGLCMLIGALCALADTIRSRRQA